MNANAGVAMDVHLGPQDLQDTLEEDARAGLTAVPKYIPSKYFYDATGSTLFDEITRLDEYYLTRAEKGLLHRHVADIVRLTHPKTLIELGSGTSEKTTILLEALAADRLETFVPFDVDEVTLGDAATTIVASFPSLKVHGVVGDFEKHLDLLPAGDARLIAFLGSTIGNLDPEGRRVFLASLTAGMRPGDFFLLGTDLVKDRGRLEAAYNDSLGLTARFNRNILGVLNDRLDANFDPASFEHIAFFDPQEEWIEMRLRSSTEQTVDVRAIGLDVKFAAGEEITTEISCKFTEARIRSELAAAGCEVVAWWSDGDFALSLSALQPAKGV